MKPYRKIKDELTSIELFIRYLEDFTHDELFIIINEGINLSNYEDYTPWSGAHYRLMEYTNQTDSNSMSDEEEKLFNEIFTEVMLYNGYSKEEINYSWTDKHGIISNPYQ